MVAQKHYWRVTNADFEKDAAQPEGALQKAVYSEAATGNIEELGEPAAAGFTGNDGHQPHCTEVQMSLSGLEPETYGLKVRCSTD